MPATTQVNMKTKLAIYNEHANIIEFHYIHAMHNAMLVFRAGNESLQNEADRSILTSKLATDGQHLFTDGKLALPSVPSVPMDKVIW